MSKTDLWLRAADAMRQDEDPRWHAVSSWLTMESRAQNGLEPFVDLLNVAYEQAGGPAGYIRFGRRSDGEVAMVVDTNEGATAVALAYLEGVDGS